MKTILQVEDDPNDVFLLRHAMTKMRVDNPIQVVSDGQQAIDYLQGTAQFGDRTRFPLPFLMLLDLKLPYVTGFGVLRWIRQHYSETLPVIVLTSSGDETDITTAYRLGANAFLTKPSEVGQLEEMVKAIKDFWLTRNTLPGESGRERTWVQVESATNSSGRNGRTGPPREQERTNDLVTAK